MNISRFQLFGVVIMMALTSGLASAQGPDGASDDSYYSDGVRIALEASPDWVAVRMRDPGDKASSVAFPAAVAADRGRDLSKHRLVMLPIRERLSGEARQALFSDLHAMSEVEMVVPVYRSHGALMIVTDEFIASFADGISQSEINRINRAHDVEIVRRLQRGNSTYVLRVAGGVALDTANRFHELSEIDYAHPDFVRVMPPRPIDLQPGDQRLIVAPDGSILPSNTRIEKGRNDLRIVEPSSATLPTFEKGSSPKVAPPSVTRVQIKTEGFEGEFPDDWTLYGNPSWGEVSYRSFSGSKSGYSVGSSVAPPGPYPYNANSWMVYGPFDLSDAEDAQVNLKAWINTESGYDFFKMLASINGVNFSGSQYSGDIAGGLGGWVDIAFDLKRAGSLGDLRGESEVWIGLIFVSDEVYNYEGVYVDEVVIEKITGGYANLTSDEFDHLQWSLSNNQQMWGIDGADIQAPDAWGVTLGSDSITLAILDDGVDLTHPDLAGKLVAGYDATDGGGTGGGAPTRNDSHGTGCAGIAGAITDNSAGVAGIARAAKIMPVRIFYEDADANLISSDSWMADAFDWAVANGADVLSNSWGGGSPSTIINEAIADAKSNGRGGLGSVVVFASGNANGPVIYPGSLDSVLTVGASSPCDERKAPSSCDGEFWWGSCYGNELDIVAPGVHMYTTDMVGTAGYDEGDYNYNFNGTSSATPVVAGVAALVLGQDPTMTAAEVEAQLMATADDLGASGWDQETGFGRINAYRAVTEALPTCYPLTLGHTGLGADPTATPPASPGCSAGQFFGGETVTLNAAPSPGWVVSSWSGTVADGSTSITNTLTMPSSPHSAGVTYSQIPCFALNVSHSGMGADPTANPAMSAGCDQGSFYSGESVTLTAFATEGWTVNGWFGTDDDGSLAPNNIVTMPASIHAAGVSYVSVPPGCYVLHRRHSGSGSDPVPTPWNSAGCPGGTYTAGENISLAADPSAEWIIGGWVGTVDDSSFLATNTLSMPASDHTVRVRYVTPTLIVDLLPGPQGAFTRSDGSVVSYTVPTNIGSTLFVAANDGVHGMELWKSDGSEAGTVLVKDIWPGSGSAFPWSTSDTWFSQTFVNVNGSLFFVADDGVHNYEVWKSDGTAPGTVMVKDVYDSWDQLPANLTAVGDTLFFSHADGTHGVELWKSNGTTAGTVMVKDINPGAGDSDLDDLTAFNGMLVFEANDGVNGREPWISDGTENGTVMLKDINSSGNSVPREFEQSGNEVFFSADDGSIGLELWKSDGTTAGTVLVKDISPWGAGINRGSESRVFTDVNGTVFFRAVDSIGVQVNHGRELWKSDGTAVGTVMVKDISPGSKDSWPDFLTPAGDELFFKAITPDQGTWGGELWKTDGTGAGTVMVKDIFPNPNPINMWPINLTECGGSLLFVADDSVHGRELWRSDGSEAGTTLVRDINIGGYASSPDWITDADGVVFFRAFEGTHGREMWALVDPSDCHFLTIGLTGTGSVPVTDPTQSAGCDPGFFETGEAVTLTAAPASGWELASWTGTDDDGSTSLVNQVTMPGVDHMVTVNYSALPIFLDGFESGDTTQWSNSVGQ